MVHLSRIYTKSGDDGSTGLGDGSRRAKHDLRIASYGTVDETSAVLGVVMTHLAPEADAAEAAEGAASAPTSTAGMYELLRRVQNELFDVGADLCVPGEGGAKLRILASYTKRLESSIDEYNARLTPLNTFVLPGGKPVAAYLHQARTVCRRAERRVCRLAEVDGEEVNPEVVRYLNRLSDLFFVLARVANDDGRLDVLWEPGESQKTREPDQQPSSESGSE